MSEQAGQLPGPQVRDGGGLASLWGSPCLWAPHMPLGILARGMCQQDVLMAGLIWRRAALVRPHDHAEPSQVRRGLGCVSQVRQRNCGWFFATLLTMFPLRLDA